MSDTRLFRRDARRVTMEVAVIVFSILLAFAIDAGWESRQERARVRATLASVWVEVSANRTEMQEAIESNEDFDVLLESFLDRSAEELESAGLDNQRFLRYAIDRPLGYDAGGGALETLVSSGDLSLVADVELRNQLVAWRRIPDEIQEDFTAAVVA